jgi:hypothetical protein
MRLWRSAFSLACWLPEWASTERSINALTSLSWMGAIQHRCARTVLSRRRKARSLPFSRTPPSSSPQAGRRRTLWPQSFSGSASWSGRWYTCRNRCNWQTVRGSRFPLAHHQWRPWDGSRAWSIASLRKIPGPKTQGRNPKSEIRNNLQISKFPNLQIPRFPWRLFQPRLRPAGNHLRHRRQSRLAGTGHV